MARSHSAAFPREAGSSTAVVSSPFSAATYLVIVIALMASALSVVTHPRLTLVIAALLWGWSEIDGLCGTSHLCTLTPLRALDPTRALWVKGVSAYTIGGVFPAAFVGAILGLLGRWANLGSQTEVFVIIAALAVILTARELELIRFPLPEVRRQTQKMWAFEFGFVTAAAMWGSHIGLGVATVVKHGGFFVLIAFTMALGPAYGAILFVTYWLGRTLPIWVTPLLTSNDADGDFLDELLSARPAAYRHAAATGLLCAGIVAVTLAT